MASSKASEQESAQSIIRCNNSSVLHQDGTTRKNQFKLRNINIVGKTPSAQPGISLEGDFEAMLNKKKT
jgi:hypothetical protein